MLISDTLSNSFILTSISFIEASLDLILYLAAKSPPLNKQNPIVFKLGVNILGYESIPAYELIISLKTSQNSNKTLVKGNIIVQKRNIIIRNIQVKVHDICIKILIDLHFVNIKSKTDMTENAVITAEIIKTINKPISDNYVIGEVDCNYFLTLFLASSTAVLNVSKSVDADEKEAII